MNMREILKSLGISILSLSAILIFEFGLFVCLFVCLMVFNAGFNNVSFISWRSVLLVEETGENHRPVANH
jgi:hypothetical protein